MSQKPDIKATVNAFFQLWQRQVTLLAQSPEQRAEELVSESKRIAEYLKAESDRVSDPDTGGTQ
ncbi:hypothetical protein A9Q83_15230 [Alphaproteobacteria bacterium 46_93_T64]|nr:hypothetical protein A9Q83_15230 [Alphaproteobacteria bacterium 46_93_T64]